MANRMVIARRAGIGAAAAVAIQATLVLAAVADPTTVARAAAESASSPAPQVTAAATERPADRPASPADEHLAALADAPGLSPRRHAQVAAALTDLDSHTLARHGAVARAEAEQADVFAVVDGLDLRLPGQRIVTIGYHEAREEHLDLAPRGTAVANHGLGPTPTSSDAGHDYVILPTRGREGSPTSAVDVVLPAGEDVLAPISGRVVSVAPYLLYDEHEDLQVQIVPDGRPDLVVTLYHVDQVRVRIGQHVTAGETVIAGTARVFDFVAQVEQWGRGPHVDLRVHRA